jgi:hypothetical protein
MGIPCGGQLINTGGARLTAKRGMGVAMLSSVSTQPHWSSGTTSLSSSVRGTMPTKMKMPSVSSSWTSFVLRFSTRRVSTLPLPSNPRGSWLHRTLILGCSTASFAVDASAWNWSNWWIMVTLFANWVRNSDSSTAELPPPMTWMSLPSKYAPSQVAQ